MEEYQDRSLRGRVFEKLREDILSGVYKDCDELREITIGEEMGVSRTPVREALRQLELEGLLDTGNGLTDPVSRSPVSLVDRAYMELLLKGDRTERIPRMIPYQTISQKGILTAYRIDIMKIRNLSETVEIQKPWIAVMPQSAGRYPLILHRDLLSS